ncbi:MAG TPA: SRPBCC family protein [Usitatibacter sp.]|nr:SRPBCC family protein [Usitatibacter sp.]
MKVLQWTLAAIGAVALAIVVVGLFLPSSFRVERSVQIGAPPDRVFDFVVEPRKWAEWGVWTKRDPQMRITYRGPPFGLGARWSWESRSEGDGSMEITGVDPGRRVEYSLYLAGFNLRTAGSFVLVPAAGGTRVTWTQEGDLGGNPLKHYIAAAMDRLVGPDFEQGLANLKSVAEKP